MPSIQNVGVVSYCWSLTSRLQVYTKIQRGTDTRILVDFGSPLRLPRGIEEVHRTDSALSSSLDFDTDRYDHDREGR
jgi:hypothetical protein